MPKSCPIIFNSESVRAILEDRKTQSRRTRGLNQLNDPASQSWWHLLRTKDDTWTFTHPSLDYGHAVIKCPYGIPGDKLWVRETWAIYDLFMKLETFSEEEEEIWLFAGKPLPNMKRNLIYRADLNDPDRLGWRPSIHMPKWASRITLEIKDVRVERVQEITTSDIIAEGITIPQGAEGGLCLPKEAYYDRNFRILWDSINAKKGFGWEMNPFVFVLEFEVIL